MSLSQVPFCLANMYGAAFFIKACGSVKGWMTKYVIKLAGGFSKWIYASSDMIWYLGINVTAPQKALLRLQLLYPAAASWLPLEGVTGDPTKIFL